MEIFDIYIVGTGATGSHLISNLAQYAIGEKLIKSITLIDGDKVEPHNFLNQKFSKKEVFKNKAEALSDRYSKLDINIGYIDKYITSEKELVKILTPKSHSYNTPIPILISCVDNNNVRKIFNDVFYNKEIEDIIYIDTGNGDVDRKGQVVTGAKHKNKVINPPVAEYFPQILDGDEDKPVDFSCSEINIEKPQNITSNVLSSTMVFLILVNIITYRKTTGKYYTFDAEKIELKKVL